MQGIKNALYPIIQSSSILEKLSNAKGENIDLKDLIFNKNKIIVLRFTPDVGSLSSYFTRIVIEKFYQEVFSRPISKKQKPIFMIADEFQDFANFDTYSRYNDKDFISRAR